MDRRPGAALTIDCGTCPVQHVGCADCVVQTLLAPTLRDPEHPSGLEPAPGTELALDRREREVISRLVASGLVGVQTANEARAVHEPRSQYDEQRRFAG